MTSTIEAPLPFPSVSLDVLYVQKLIFLETKRIFGTLTRCTNVAGAPLVFSPTWIWL